ncbi:MAG: RIP metalloprotease RseP [Pseudomonadota bacterium]
MSLETILLYGPPFIIILSVVVFVHEYGHYWVARRNGVKVEVFSIGFGRELFGIHDKAGTRWKFSLIPLGGYVKMLGDADASSSHADPEHSGEPNAFPSKSVWQRMAIVVAGPAANFLFAILVLALLYGISGRPFAAPTVGNVFEDGAAAEAGIETGDRIVAINGQPMETFADLQGIVQNSADVPLQLTIRRDEQEFGVTVTPKLRDIEGQEIGLIGVEPGAPDFRRLGPVEAIFDAGQDTYRMVTLTLGAVGEMIVGSRGTDELGGPLRIAQMAGDVAQQGFQEVVWFTAILSINLGLINLFPVPMLDGGHLVMYAIEAGRGRPLTERAQEIAFRFGLAMVLTLMVFATWNDLVHLNVIEFFSGLIS